MSEIVKVSNVEVGDSVEMCSELYPHFEGIVWDVVTYREDAQEFILEATPFEAKWRVWAWPSELIIVKKGAEAPLV